MHISRFCSSSTSSWSNSESSVGRVRPRRVQSKIGLVSNLRPPISLQPHSTNNSQNECVNAKPGAKLRQSIGSIVITFVQGKSDAAGDNRDGEVDQIRNCIRGVVSQAGGKLSAAVRGGSSCERCVMTRTHLKFQPLHASDVPLVVVRLGPGRTAR